MFDSIFILLAALFVKHWYIDFVIQTPQEVAEKGTYFKWHGIKHSLKHAIATGLVFWIFADSVIIDCVFLGVLDFLFHYHIDWAKMNINRKFNYTIEKPEFWYWLGADQLAHCFTYLFLVWFIL